LPNLPKYLRKFVEWNVVLPNLALACKQEFFNVFFLHDFSGISMFGKFAK